MGTLAFDVNVAMSGYAAEAKAARDAGSGGKINSRSDALRSLERASAQVYEMEEERRKRSG